MHNFHFPQFQLAHNAAFSSKDFELEIFSICQKDQAGAEDHAVGVTGVAKMFDGEKMVKWKFDNFEGCTITSLPTGWILWTGIHNTYKKNTGVKKEVGYRDAAESISPWQNGGVSHISENYISVEPQPPNTRA